MLRNHKLTDSIALEGNDHLESKNTFEIEEKEESFLKNSLRTLQAVKIGKINIISPK